MRQHFPSYSEVLFFVVVAIVGAALVARLANSAHDLGMSAIAAPVFLVASIMGLRRNWARSEGDNA